MPGLQIHETSHSVRRKDVRMGCFMHGDCGVSSSSATSSRQSRAALTSTAAAKRRSVLSQMGSIGRPIWMSTGIYDVDVMPAYVQTLAAQIKQVSRSHRALLCVHLVQRPPAWCACSSFGRKWLTRLSSIALLCVACAE